MAAILLTPSTTATRAVLQQLCSPHQLPLPAEAAIVLTPSTTATRAEWQQSFRSLSFAQLRTKVVIRRKARTQRDVYR